MYIHLTTCISPQQTFEEVDFSVLYQPVEKMLKAKEPDYTKIPPGILRRMTKPMRLGVGAAMPLLSVFTMPDGIIIGTAHTGMEDSFLFLKQIVEYEEGLLTPIHFVQSTPNAVAGQLGILNQNKGYNVTHTHLGLAFENAIIDASMIIKENPSGNYLLGAVDDIAFYNYNFRLQAGWYKSEATTTENFYNNTTAGTVAGEGAAFFLVNGNKNNAIAKLNGINTLHTTAENIVQEHLQNFIDTYLPAEEKIDLFLSGENGDNRLVKFYTTCENILPNDVAIYRYKHLCGEYPTAVSFACWLACYIFQQNTLPAIFIKKNGNKNTNKYILLYNNYNGVQHSFMLFSRVVP